MRKISTLSTLLGLAALSACATTKPPLQLEIPVRQALTEPCEQLAIPREDQLPAVAQDPHASEAQLAERRYWTSRDLDHEGIERRLCRQRDEAVAVIGQANQAARGER